MSRNFYILSWFARAVRPGCGGHVTGAVRAFSRGFPANASLWRTVSMVLLLFGLLGPWSA